MPHPAITIDSSKKLRYPVAALPADTTVLDAYPDLKDHKALVEYGSDANDPFLRYAILLAEGTNLHRTFSDFSERKHEALRLAGVLAGHERYQGAFDLTDKGVQNLRWTWLKLFSSRKFRAYIALCAAYDRNCMLVEAMSKDGDYTDLGPQNVILETLEHELFFGDADMQQLVMENVAKENMDSQKALVTWEDLVMDAAAKKKKPNG